MTAAALFSGGRTAGLVVLNFVFVLDAHTNIALYACQKNQ